MVAGLRKTGIDVLGDAPWGTHFCQFYQTREDLLDILVPYFKAGLENNEFCMWVTSAPLGKDEATKALRSAVPDLDGYLGTGQIEILPHTEWYLKDGAFDAQRVMAGWVDKLNGALAAGFEGLRLTGNTHWLEEADWDGFADYEQQVNNVLGKYRMLALCSYGLDKCGAAEILDVVGTHQFALIRREGKWAIIESSDRKRTEEALRQSEEYSRLLVENVADYAIFMLDADGVVRSWNRGAERIKGYQADEIIGQHFSVFYPPEDVQAGKPQHHLQAAAAEGRSEDDGWRVRKDGSRFFANVVITALRDEAGHLRGFTKVTRDITERKQAEEELLLAAQRWEITFDGVPDAIALLGVQANVLQCNSAMAELAGKRPEECVGRTCCELVHGSLQPLEGCPLLRARSSLRRENLEVPVGQRWLRITVDPLKDDEGRFAGAVHGVVDITKRKAAEEEIADLAKFPAENPDPVLRVSGEGTITSANNAAQPLLDAWSCQPGAVLPRKWAKLIREVLVSGHREDIEIEGDGRIFLITFAPIVEAGYVNLYGHDITDRKQAEEERAKLLKAIQTTKEAINITDPDAVMIYTNDAMDELFGYEEGELIGKHVSIVNAGTREQAMKVPKEVTDTIRKNGVWESEIRNKRKDGTEFISLAKVAALTSEQGEVINYVCSQHDITERKRMQEEQRIQSEITANMSEGTHLVRLDDGVIIYANPKFEEIFGYSPGEMVGKHISIVNAPTGKTPEETATEIIGALDKHGSWQGEIRNIKKDGTLFWSYASVTVFHHPEHGKVAVSVHTDITDRKRAEESLGLSHVCLKVANKERDTAPLLREFVAEVQAFTRCAAVGIRLLNERGNIPYEAHTGFSKRFYESESPLSIKSDECMCINVIKGDTHPGLPFYTEGGSFYMNATTRFLATVSQEDKGQTRNVCNEFGYESVALVPIASEGRIVGLIHVADPKENMVPLEAVNVLEKTALQLGTAVQRVAAEQDVRRSHKELRALAARLQTAREEERILLARKIHDDVGHNLAALKRELAWLGGRFPKAAGAPPTPKLRDRLESMSKLLAETIQTAKETASELRPGLLDDVGLAAAIEWEAKQFQRRTGVKCRFTDTAEQTQFDHEQSTALFRICQGLLTNIASHAGATAVTIALKKQADELILEVSDNGKGIRKKQISSSRSLGILGMRERALVLGGAFSIWGKPGKGTTATVQIPLGAAQAKGQ